MLLAHFTTVILRCRFHLLHDGSRQVWLELELELGTEVELAD